MLIWGGTTYSVLNPFIIQQNKAIRTCFNKKKKINPNLQKIIIQNLMFCPKVNLLYKTFAIFL